MNSTTSLMAPYLDKYGMAHIKLVGPDLGPSTNDSMIVTAYAHKIGLDVDLNNVGDYALLLKHKKGIPTERIPGRPYPPPSRDFFLACAYFKICWPKWNFSPWELPTLNIFKLAYQLYKLIGEHRNTFWKERGFEQVGHIAFKVPLVDRAFYYRCFNKRVPIFYRVVEWIDKKRKPHTASSYMIRYLKYDQIPPIDTFIDFFGPSHSITVKRVEI